jgi:hypothetical protein
MASNDMKVNKLYFDAFNKGELVIDFGAVMANIEVWNFHYTLFPELNQKDFNNRYFLKVNQELRFFKRRNKAMKNLKIITSKELANPDVKKDVLPLPIL